MTIWNYVGSLSWHCETKLSIYRHKENLDVINTDDGTYFVEQCQTDRMFTRSLKLANVSMRIKSDTKKRLVKKQVSYVNTECINWIFRERNYYTSTRR